ncbi:LytTR family DNA-binding domain-containing protein [Duganella sp. Root1480D1]|uniref:LytR/AlgR family response regulator transcription factor n=1 Tax=Duganella sp. Root1480D1 TaxID=1736471 RepID=UPI00070B7291|nr:LytTR family DNA-binding domain-containing protein [Duganella sp. Root1480D1]KQZ28263.1 LytTR family transcriptional regulator [Duganella sp. Root1480D1]
MPTAIIADDEELPRGELRRMLAEVWPTLNIVAECEHGTDALEAIYRWQPDIAFLDIRMPGLSGLDVAKAVGGRCRAVFVTAYDSHAIDAFAAGAIDYLLKPVVRERLMQTIGRLRERTCLAQPIPDLDGLMAELDQRMRGAATRIRWISASVGDTIKVIPIEDVIFFQSDEKYTRVVTSDDEAHVRKPIKELADCLDPGQFWQVHRSVIVRASSIARVQRDEMGRITIGLRGLDETLKASQAYAWQFRPM